MTGIASRSSTPTSEGPPNTECIAPSHHRTRRIRLSSKERTMAGVAGNSSWWNPIPHFTAALQRHRRTTFFLGFVSGLILSLGSVSSVLLLYERREKRRRRRRLRQYGIDEQGLERERAKSSIELRSGEIVRGIEGLIGACTNAAEKKTIRVHLLLTPYDEQEIHR